MPYSAWWAIWTGGCARSDPFDVGAVPLLFGPGACTAKEWLGRSSMRRGQHQRGTCSNIQRIAPGSAVLPVPHYGTDVELLPGLRRIELRPSSSFAAVFSRKSSTPIGDTRIGRNGKKNRLFTKGMKNPTPFPPVVIASRIPCDNSVMKRNVNAARNEMSL